MSNLKTHQDDKENIILSGTASLIFFISMGLVLNSCDKSDDNGLDDTQKILAENVNSEINATEVFDEVLEIADEAVYLYETTSSDLKSEDTFGFSRLSECVTVTREVLDGIVTCTIDFGDTDCLCNDGRLRRGKIIMQHEGRYWDSLVYITFTFDNFFVNNNQVVGNKSVTQTINSNNQRVSTIVIDGSLILADNGGAVQFSSEKTRTIVEGSDTRTKRDDLIETTGHSTITIDSVEIVMTIVEPLVRKNEPGCFMYIIQGILQIEKTGQPTITIDFGVGTCDNLADLTVGGVTTTIELKRSGFGIR